MNIVDDLNNCPRQDLNLRPPDYESGALPN